MSFKDHFSDQSADYAAYRPNYPREFFSWLVAQTQSQQLAWDCACGNGQAAIALADYFDRVIATDASKPQIREAQKHPVVTYQIALAENSGLSAQSVDLLTVAQAAHWFDHALFFKEAKRVLKPGGILAIWGYSLLRLGDSLLEEILSSYYSDVVGPYWPPERHWIDSGYRDLPFPFGELRVPAFEMRTRWRLDNLIDYVSTWSATKRYMADNRDNPLLDLEEKLQRHWGCAERTMVWPMRCRIGRHNES